MGRELLIVDDEPEACQSLARALSAISGFDVKVHLATNATQALQICKQRVISVAVLDLCIDSQLGVESGFELLQALLRRRMHCRAIILTGNGSIEHGVRALKLGAANFIEKPANIQHLAALVEDGFAQHEIRCQASRRDKEIVDAALVGSSKAIEDVRSNIRFAARTQQAVFLSGETGTGKGVCARLIHRLSARSSKRFVRYQPNFSGPDLVNSDLCGHRRGAFTGATDERAGLLEDANGGTLFLDEVDELPLPCQVMLLGILQDQKYRPVGATQERSSNFRIITASNSEIKVSLRSGRLRRDFYHRVAQTVIHLPPLRQRLEDIPELALHFVEIICARENLRPLEIDSGCVAQLQGFQWPGNVRQLQSVVESAALRAEFRGAGRIQTEDLPPLDDDTDLAKIVGNFHEQVEEYKIRLIEEALERNEGNQVKAAKELSLDRSSLRRTLARGGR